MDSFRRRSYNQGAGLSSQGQDEPAVTSPTSAVVIATIWLSLGMYAAALCPVAVESPSPPDRWRRAAWTAGCGLLLLHFAAAFHFVHDWRHAAAEAETARRTKDLLGWEFGGGVYFNYAFALLWLADVAWWWAAPRSRRQRPVAAAVLLHGFMLLIWINGAVVFVDGPIRWVGAAALAAATIGAVMDARRTAALRRQGSAACRGRKAARRPGLRLENDRP